MNAKPVGDIIKRHNIKYHCSANDTQMYMTLKPCEKQDDNSTSIEAFIADIGTWMNTNMLTLYTDKT